MKSGLCCALLAALTAAALPARAASPLTPDQPHAKKPEAQAWVNPPPVAAKHRSEAEPAKTDNSAAAGEAEQHPESRWAERHHHHRHASRARFHRHRVYGPYAVAPYPGMGPSPNLGNGP